jgi:hypothetical protein
MARCGLWLLLVLPLSSLLTAQVRPLKSVPPVSSVSSLQFLTARAGLIFAGTVLSLQCVRPSRPNETESVEVRFRVDQPVRGASLGPIVRIREWGGLWVGRPPYLAGQRLMVFLYLPSRLGLTSLVTGIGNFPVDRQGWLQPSPAQQKMLDESGVLSRIPVRGGRMTVRDFAQILRTRAAE